MGLTSIEWTDRTWNPVRGCSRVSEGCRNCYAEITAARFSNYVQLIAGSEPFLADDSGNIKAGLFDDFVLRTPSGPRWTGKVELIESKLTEPLHWKKPQRVFVNSMSDLFHEALPDEAIDRVFAVMADCPHLTFQILTKRPERMLKWFSSGLQMKVNPPWSDPNVWIGVSVEDQATADARIPLLLQTPAAIRFVSYEPALGPVDFRKETWTAGLDWIIAGGESGPGARPPHPDWFRSVRDQCAAAGVAFFFKQWGGTKKPTMLDGTRAPALLDGRAWKQFPK